MITLRSVLAVSLAVAGRPDVEIALGLAEGESVGFTITSEEVVTPATSEKLRATVAYEQAVTLRRVPLGDAAADGAAHAFELTFERATGKAKIPLAADELTFDSEDERELKFFEVSVFGVLREPIGKSVRVELAESGRVVAVRGWQAIFEGTPIGKMSAFAGVPLTDEWFALKAQLLFPQLPDGSVASGARWTRPFVCSVYEHPVPFETEYEVTALDDHAASWSLAGSLPRGAGAAPADAAAPAEPVEREPADGADPADVVHDLSRVLDATLVGATTVSRADGLPLERTLDFVIRVAAPPPLGGKPVETTCTQRFRVVRAVR